MIYYGKLQAILRPIVVRAGPAALADGGR